MRKTGPAMLLRWLEKSEANVVGTALADDVVVQTALDGANGAARAAAQERDLQRFLQKFLQRVDRETRPLRLNVFKRASLANSFKWRLLEKGVEPKLVDELTEALVLRLTTRDAARPQLHESVVVSKRRPGRDAVQALLAQGSEYALRGALDQAVESYNEALTADPGNVIACTAVGQVLCRLGRYSEAGQQFQRAIKIKESFAEAHCNLGSLLRSLGQIKESEQPLRRALNLK